ncbi:uncharacterized protein LOC129895311 [Solanum dulcamara]|uniref:uncharacterized protein LOC129895311 n=1 Tax=Solanum dulcamara TaxID=45834 RepID=UPI0024865485|nr:uncharacterized protein LOC129895311 [Solanum dulcamara]
MYTAEATSGSMEIGDANLNGAHETAGPTSYEYLIIGHNHPLYLHPNDTPVLSWIMNVITPGLLSSIVYAGDAHKVWSDLKERFDKINGCYCAESKRFQEHFEYQRLLKFLMGLNEFYSTARGQILMQNPIPNLNKAYFLIVDHESQRNLASSYHESVTSKMVECTALFSKNGGNGPNQGGNFGHQPGVKGYPVGWKSKKKREQFNSNSYANQAEVTQCGGPNSTGDTPSPTALFTQDQYHHILQMLARRGENGREHSAKAATAGSALSVLVSKYVDKSWIVDTGETNHMISNTELLNNFHTVSPSKRRQVMLPTGNVVSVSHIGSINILGNQSIGNVLFDLFSGQVKGIGKEDQGLYILKEGSPKAEVNGCSTQFQGVAPTNSTSSSVIPTGRPTTTTLWNLRQGHVPVDIIKKSSSIEVLDNEYSTCTVFPLAKQTKLPFPVHNLFSTTVNTLRTDNGCEFLSIVFQNMLSTLGILHQTTCVYTPQQNGVTERKHKTILEMARALKFQSSVPLKFWGECVTTTVYLLNRIPSKLLQFKTPFEMLHLHSPSLAHIKVFGCLCYATVPHILDKFSPRAIPAVLMGYSSSKKGYLLYDLHSKSFFVNRYAVFKEDICNTP